MDRLPGYERAALISADTIAANTRAIAERLDGARLMAVVKADAYGHGALTSARAALAGGASALGTAHVREALDLRSGIGHGPQIVAWLHTNSTDFEAALRNGITLGVSGPEVDSVLRAAQQTGVVPDVHVKVDTGLGRNGAGESSWEALFARLAEAQAAGALRVTGIMSHLAVADEPARPETDAQRAAFLRACALAEAAGLTGLTRHCANTAATLDRDDLHFDMVRVGIGLYGLSPFADREPEEFGLRPAMRLVTRLSMVKAVPAGQGVSYGLLYRAARPTHLGLVPLGYADGIPRIAEGAQVLVGGQRRDVVGRIAMDQMVVDLGPNASAMGLVGSEVTVFGGPGAPTATDWAAAARTINYEIVTRISGRVDRIEVDCASDSADSSLASLLGEHSAEDAEAMRLLGERFGTALEAGDVVVLSGPLGAGKTTLTQGIARGLGADGQVISPTFVLSRIHRNNPDGPRPGGPDLVHVDAYRLGPDGDLDDLGLDDTLQRSVTVVEWGENISPELGRRTLLVRIERALTLGGGLDDDGALDFDDEEAHDPRTVTISFLQNDAPGHHDAHGDSE